jgi:hypothetical protein
MRQIYIGLMIIFLTISFLTIRDGSKILTLSTGFEVKLNNTESWFIAQTVKYIEKIKYKTGTLPTADHVNNKLGTQKNTAYEFLGIRYIPKTYPDLINEVYGHPPGDGFVLEFTSEYKKAYYISWIGDSKKAFVVIEENYYRFLFSLIIGILSLIIASLYVVKYWQKE